MTHIIGRPPAPKGGATFGEARRHDVFDALDPEDPGDPGDSEAYVRWVKSSATTAYQLTAPKAGAGIRFSPDWSIVPLDITPRDPEPDPAVCTSDGLTKGQWYEGADGTLTLRGDVVDMDVNGESDNHLPPGDPATFRRVAASVVEHGELGHNEAGIGVSPSYGDLHDVSLGHGSRRLHREELEELVCRAVAYLAWLDAQEPASPESGEPESAGMCSCGPDSKSHPSFKHAESCPMAKPAPEWRLHKHLPGWYSTCRNGYVVGPKHATEADAIAYTHTDEAQREYDAQQAGKGGE